MGGRREKAKRAFELSEMELKVMLVIWKLGGCSATAVQESLGAQENYAYTTISTVLRLLEQRGVLSSIKNGRAHMYCPELSKEEYENQAVRNLAHTVFQDDALMLVQRLVESKNLSSSELAALKALIDRQVGES
jgi:predicted transcriptional regulator